MKTIQADQWTPQTTAYLWQETGNGSLLQVSHITQDWWIGTKGSCSMSWCCCPDTTLYVFDTHEEFERINAEMQRQLENRRSEWNKR